MLFNNFKDDWNVKALNKEQKENDLLLNKLIKKCNLKVGNYSEARKERLCLITDEYIIENKDTEVPVTR